LAADSQFITASLRICGYKYKSKEAVIMLLRQSHGVN